MSFTDAQPALSCCMVVRPGIYSLTVKNPGILKKTTVNCYIKRKTKIQTADAILTGTSGTPSYNNEMVLFNHVTQHNTLRLLGTLKGH